MSAMLECMQCCNNALLIVNTVPGGSQQGGICQFNCELFLQHSTLPSNRHSNTAEKDTLHFYFFICCAEVVVFRFLERSDENITVGFKYTHQQYQMWDKHIREKCGSRDQGWKMNNSNLNRILFPLLCWFREALFLRSNYTIEWDNYRSFKIGLWQACQGLQPN